MSVEYDTYEFTAILFVWQPDLVSTTFPARKLMADLSFASALSRLKDMDGTLIDSTLAVEGAWATFAKTYTHFDIHEILKSESYLARIDEYDDSHRLGV